MREGKLEKPIPLEMPLRENRSLPSNRLSMWLDFSRFFTYPFFPTRVSNKFLMYINSYDSIGRQFPRKEIHRNGSQGLISFIRDRNGSKIKESEMVAVVNPICLVSLSAGMGREEDAHFSQ